MAPYFPDPCYFSLLRTHGCIITKVENFLRSWHLLSSYIVVKICCQSYHKKRKCCIEWRWTQLKYIYELNYNLCHIFQVPLISYLIFVISFTQAGFFNSKFLHPKINTHKNSKICIFLHSIWKILHLTELFYTGTCKEVWPWEMQDGNWIPLQYIWSLHFMWRKMKEMVFQTCWFLPWNFKLVLINQWITMSREDANL